ncbi:SGNH/GDSL hydrolase family protein [Kribbella endophytica]
MSLRLSIALTTALLTTATVITTAPAYADGPGTGTPYVVTVGDSYISGEAGRWAGSSNNSEAPADALGAHAYHDNAAGTGEQIAKCHRSKSAEAYIGGGVGGLNLACSGARTATSNGDDFKPGLDFFDNGAGRLGQAKLLQQFATTHNVKQVVVSIGGNDFNFASIVQSCVTDFLLSPSWFPDYCKDDSSVVANFTAANVTAVRGRISTAFQNVATAMRNAGYADNAWTLLVQTYPSPIPAGSGFRYGQSGYTRQSVGGCGFWNTDADWANATALTTINNTVRAAIGQSGLTNTRLLELQSTFNGRRLCEKTVGLYEEVGLTSWTQPTAVDKTEWVNQIRTVTTVGSNYFIQESIHPNYWGQLALRSCIRQTYVQSRGGTCTIAGPGLTNGEPQMTLN